MSHRHHPSTWQLFVLATALLLCSGGLHATSAQLIGPLESGVSRPNRAPNPRTNVHRTSGKRPDNRSGQPSSKLSQPPPNARPDEKQQAIEQAIAQGNQARDANDYEQALSQYQKAQTLNPQDARAFYGMGNLYSDLYCNDSAIEAYLKALKLKKDYLEALLALGYTYAGKERYDEAEGQFQAALKIAPNNPEANIGLGLVYMKKGKYQEAIKQINQVINDQSIKVKDLAAAHIALGYIYWRQEKKQEAISQYEKAISLKPDLARAYVVLGYAQLSFAFSKLVALGYTSEVSPQDLEALRASAKQATKNMERGREHGYNHPKFYIYMGYALLYQFRYQDAVNLINDYLAKVKELESRLPSLAKECAAGFNRLNADGYWYLGFVYKTEGDFEADDQRKKALLNKALEPVKQAVKLQQDYYDAYWMMGNIYTKLQKYEEAISQYQNAIRYSPEGNFKAYVYDRIGFAYLTIGRRDKAIEYVQEAVRLIPNEPEFYETLSLIYMSQFNLDEALNWLKKATELRTTPSTNPHPYSELGSIYIFRFIKNKNEEDFNEAIKWLKKALEIRPTYAPAYTGLGMAYKIHSNADEALANFSKAAEYDPKSPYVYVFMASVYSELKHNDDAAIERLMRAIDLKPDYAEAHWQLGVAYQHKKNDAEAIKHMLKTIEFEPKYLPAYLALASIYRVQKNYPEALKHLNKVAEIAPTNSAPYREIAEVYEDQRKNEDAVHYYEEAIIRLKADDLFAKNLYLGRIARLQGHYEEAIGYFQKLQPPPWEPVGQLQYDIGLTYVANKNRTAALEQHQQLVQLKSPLAEELLKKIKEMK